VREPAISTIQRHDHVHTVSEYWRAVAISFSEISKVLPSLSVMVALTIGKVSEFGSPPPRLIIPGTLTKGTKECRGDGLRALLQGGEREQ